MNNTEFVNNLISIAKNYKTLYVMGCFGSPMNATNKKRFTTNHSYNKQASRTKMINAASSDTFGFDCVCLIKGVLWGWNGDKNKVYGGATYASNGVPDIGADTMITKCSDISTDFSKIEVGEAVWTTGHIGVYIGNGLAVECTPSWDNCVQITACNCNKAGYNRRNWKKHGKLPYIQYVTNSTAKPASKPASKPATSTDNFLPARGHFQQGDVSPNVGKVATFMRKVFPLYTDKRALGNLYGPYLIAAIKEFQRRTGLEPDGCLGPLTLKMLEKYGFKK